MSRPPTYTILERIHEGAATVVHRGVREADGLRVALKLLRSDQPGPAEVERLRAEHAVLAGLAVEGVPRALGLETIAGRLCLVMEELPGRPLDELLRAGRVELAAALRIGASLAGVIGRLHLSGVIHKDIKPHNILVDPDTGEARLVDLGVAALRSADAPEREGVFDGTLAYLAPEQTGRMNRRVDPRADLYACGVTLYELVTGVLPFTSNDPVELVHSHVARAPTPPHVREPAVPPAVSAVILKLLAKAPEERYQSAFGLRADLELCAERLRSSGHIEPFSPGSRDRGHELRLSPRLHGREEARRTALASWSRAARGSAELLLLAGPSGVGKSAFVDALRAELAREGGYFIAGKCDQIDRDTPYAPLERALQELVRRALGEPREVLAELRRRLLAALGPNGRVVAELVPEIELVIGPQEPAPELGPPESRNRLHTVVQRLLGAFSAPQRPLTLVLDDLQWADPATLQLLGGLLTDPEGAHLFVIGAVRDGEVGVDHPLTRTLARLRTSGRTIAEVALAPLGAAEVAAFVAETLDRPLDEVAPLADLLREKTGGNPFFLGQLLLGLFTDKLLTFAADRGAWAWNLDAIRLATGDDVLAFVREKLLALPAATRRALQFAACIGHRFDRELLARALDEPAEQVEVALSQARRGGLLVAGEAGEPGRFLHDRIQQAALASLDEAERREVHLRLARLLRARLTPEPRDDELFTLVHHANLAGVSDIGEGGELVRLNLAAARRARRAAAFAAAAGYFDAATARLDPASWERDPAWTFAIHVERAQCAYLCGRFDEAEAALCSLRTRAGSAEQRLQLASRRMELRISQSRFAEAVELGLDVLDEHAIHLPRTEEERGASLGARLGALAALIGERPVDDLLAVQPLADPEVEATVQLLTTLCMAAYYTSATVFTLAAIEQVILSVAHGRSSSSPVAYMAYAFILAAILGQYERAEAFGELALALLERYPDPRVLCRVHHMFGTIVHVRRPLRLALAHLERAMQAGLDHGDFVFLSAAADNSFPYKLALGVPLPQLRVDAARLLALVHRTQDALSIAYMSIASQLVAALEGRTRTRFSLAGDDFEEDGFAAALVRDGLYPVACWFHLARLIVCFLHGDEPGALAAAEAADALVMSAAGQFFPTELAFFACLAAAERGPGVVDAAELQRRDALLSRHGAQLAVLAASCPDNYRHKHLLVQAEVARLAGRHDEATDGYEQAIAEARAQGFGRDEAIAAERAALFHRAKGRPRIARVYMAEAHAAFVRWGATVKVAALAERHADLLPDTAASPGSIGSVTLTTRMGSAAIVDAATLVRAAQALVGEVALERVLARLMRLVVESAGAQRGALLLAPDDRLQVVARLDDDRVAVEAPLPLESATDIAAAIVRYVARTREPVVLDDATLDHRFAADPHLARARPRSILCLPLTHNDRLTGVLYLENNAASGAFTRARVDLADLLASLAATAVANAQLYARVEEVSRALRGANESLEAEVARRTDDLRATNERLAVELAERERAEQARSGLHEQVARMQDERLAELSSPILPITDRVVVMPLIGTMDAQRGRQVLEAALMGVQVHRAEVVILDVTGMKLVDVEVADMLAATARALRLLGARALVTGVSPDIAWTFIERGAELGGMTTVATLKAAVALAETTARRRPPRT